MALSEQKWKMVSFRLRPEDYAKAQEQYRSSGYRSISHFALCALRAFRPVPASPQDVITETTVLKGRVEELASGLRRLSQSIVTEPHICSRCGGNLSHEEAEPVRSVKTKDFNSDSNS